MIMEGSKQDTNGREMNTVGSEKQIHWTSWRQSVNRRERNPDSIARQSARKACRMLLGFEDRRTNVGWRDLVGSIAAAEKVQSMERDVRSVGEQRVS